MDVCPVDCIHPRKDEPEFAAAEMLYIHPDECIDCGACVPACPVEAIFALDETPGEVEELHSGECELFLRSSSSCQYQLQLRQATSLATGVLATG